MGHAAARSPGPFGAEGAHAGQQGHAVGDMVHGPDVEAPAAATASQTSSASIRWQAVARDQDALVAVQPSRRADAEKSSIFVDAADGQHLAEGVDGAGDGDALPQRQAGQRGQQGVELGRRRIALDARITLLEQAMEAVSARRASGANRADR